MSDNKELSLEELDNENNGTVLEETNTPAPTEEHAINYQPVDIADIAETKELPTGDYFSSVLNSGFSVIDQMTKQAEEILENANKELELKNFEEANNLVDGVAEGKPSAEFVKSEEEFPDTASPISMKMAAKELEEEFSEFSSSPEADKANVAIIKAKIKDAIAPIANKIDLATFTIASKPQAVFEIFKSTKKEKFVADWVLPATDLVLSMAEFGGFDIEKLNPDNSNRTEYNTMMDIYKEIYDHIENENKPELEVFLKLIRFTDIEHIFFTVFRSSFNNTNVLPYQCIDQVKCKEVFVESVGMDEHVKYHDDAARDKIAKLLASTAGSEFRVDQYETESMQVSDDYVVSIKIPSIFNVVFETTALLPAFREKHADILGIISYIDNIYYIDRENGQLVPVELIIFEKDLGKTTRYKIMQYSKILAEFTSDQFFTLSAAVANIVNDEPISYIVPSRTCPKCGKVVPERTTDAQTLLFTRHQLGAIANS